MTNKSHLKALLDQLYDVKFSKHTTLIVVLLSMFYTIYRTEHYLEAEFKLSMLVAYPTSIFIEAIVLAAAAFMFCVLRNEYITELKGIDANRAKTGVYIGYIALAGAFGALLFVALSDAWRLTGQYIPTMIMSLLQVTQMLFIVGFISAADLDEREKLRNEQKLVTEEEIKRRANQCPFCLKPLDLKHRKRHINNCPNRPATI